MLHTRLIVAGVGLDDAVIEPHVRHRHAVLRQRAGLVGADSGRGAERLDSLQVLHQTVLAGHTLGGQGQTHLHA